MALNLEKQLTFVSADACLSGALSRPRRLVPRLVLTCLKYGAYHDNSVNVAIHMVCVPLILFSGFTLVRRPFPASSSLAMPDPSLIGLSSFCRAPIPARLSRFPMP